MLDNLYADIIINISHEDLDKTFQYLIPIDLLDKVKIGTKVLIPFGKSNRIIKGYVINITNKAKIDKSYIKSINNIDKNSLVIESHLISLAYWIKETFGSTMIEALKTVMPVKRKIGIKEDKDIELIITIEEAKNLLEEFQRKKYKARERFMEALIKNTKLDYNFAIKNLSISKNTIDAFVKQGIIKLISTRVYRSPIANLQANNKKNIILNEKQTEIVDSITKEYKQGIRDTYLIHGVTGSGKTEVYLEIIDNIIKFNKEVIFLIPEIALTFQMVERFQAKFADKVSIINSKMSQGERFDQLERARNGQISIIIGPRSALFTPFKNLGLIIIDEEHEGSYKSEYPPKYHAIDVAIQRAKMLGASVILGSATPSINSYKKALDNEYKLFTIKNRPRQMSLPETSIIDLREELKNKNRTIFSNKLRELIIDRLEKKQQIMLFLNRRGYLGFVSCRECGHVIKCSHCDISLTYHKNNMLKCHYCNFEQVMPKQCPKCGSKYIATFGIGTQKVEELVKKEFKGARTLRMDKDTTSKKGDYEYILNKFSKGQADILIGTQMIAKGHDYPNVTLVGILAADMSLYVGDYMSSERTFQLICQSGGRAGRGDVLGQVVIQTYNPQHYAIVAAAKGDYLDFYKQEILYRKLMLYPPVANILLILIESKEDEDAKRAASIIGQVVKEAIKGKEFKLIGPGKAELKKAYDLYRYTIYIKNNDYKELINLKNFVEGYYDYSNRLKNVKLQFDFNPVNSY